MNAGYTYGWDLTKNACEVYGQQGYMRTNYTYTPYGDVGPHDWVGWIPIAGQLIAGVGTLVSGGGLSDTVASLGGKWGYESSADINLRFDYYGNINHGKACDLLYSDENSAKKSAYEILQNYIQK